MTAATARFTKLENRCKKAGILNWERFWHKCAKIAETRRLTVQQVTRIVRFPTAN